MKSRSIRTTSPMGATSKSPRTTSRPRLLAAVVGVMSLAIACAAAPAFGLAPDRGYEMVSPPEKGGNAIGRVSVLDGDHILFKASGSLREDDVGFGLNQIYMGTRTTDGWTSRSVLRSPISGVQTATEDGSLVVLLDPTALTPDDQDLLPGPPGQAGIGQVDVFTSQVGGLSLASTGSIGGNGAARSLFKGMSDDGSHILFGTTEQLEPEDTGRDPSASMLYERVGGTTRAVGLDSDENPIDSGGAVIAGSGFDGSPHGQANAVSADGSRVFFQSPDPAVGLNPQLYVRENGDTTTQVSLPQRSSPGNAPQPAVYQGASADGSQVFFTTTGQLTDGDVDSGSDLYRYDVDSGELTRISGGAGDAGQDAGIAGVTAVSDDGMRVYFVAVGALAQGAEAGGYNLYVYDAVVDTIDLVGTVTVNDQANLQQGGIDMAPVAASITPDGSVIVFHAEARLTSFDNGTFNPRCVENSSSNGRCREVYRYEIGDGITCVSCNAAGVPPIGNAEIPRYVQNVYGGVGRPNRYVSDDGSTVVFETGDALVPADTNSRIDAYEWRDGEPFLITSGRSGVDSHIGGMTGDGQHLFFTTDEPLATADVDISADLYDARVGADVADPDPPPAPCAASECQGEPSGPSDGSDIASRQYDGAGDHAAGPRASMRIGRLSSATVSRFAEGHRVVLRVRVNRPGRVAVTATAKLGRGTAQVATASKRAARAGVVRLKLRLSKAARKRLKSRGELAVRLNVRFGSIQRARYLSLQVDTDDRR